jgi:hypothetical protein
MRMNKAFLLLPVLLAAAAPAHATSGMTCRTAGAKPVEVTLVIGNTTGSPLVSGRLVDNGSAIEVRAVQWWLDSSELRLLLVDPQATRAEVTIKAKKNGRFYDGSLVRAGRSQWVRCRES